MALIEAKKCSDINCKYIKTFLYCPDDWFDDDGYAECIHPEAPERAFLGDDDNKDYLNIPEWCPLRKDK